VRTDRPHKHVTSQHPLLCGPWGWGAVPCVWPRLEHPHQNGRGNPIAHRSLSGKTVLFPCDSVASLPGEAFSPIRSGVQASEHRCLVFRVAWECRIRVFAVRPLPQSIRFELRCVYCLVLRSLPNALSTIGVPVWGAFAVHAHYFSGDERTPFDGLINIRVFGNPEHSTM